jgi:hypothetical protein
MNILHLALLFIVARVVLDLLLDLIVGKFGKNFNVNTFKECGAIIIFAVIAWAYGFRMWV